MSRIYKVISLNIEGEKHLHRFTQFMRDESADIVFLQEVPQHLLAKISTLLSMRMVCYDPMSYALTAYRGRNDSDSIWGMACFIRRDVSIHSYSSEYYRHQCFWDQPEIKEPLDRADRMVQRIVIKSGTRPCNILQTHFTWTKDGLPDFRQERDIELLTLELKKISEFALFGDSNIPRGRNRLWNNLLSICNDNIPFDVTTTLDEQLHRVGHLPRVVDMCFTTSGYIVDAIKIVSGLSDHQAVVAGLVLP